MSLNLVPFLPEHLPMLGRWLAARHVQFPRRTREEDLQIARDLPERHEQLIIEWEGHPIGYLHWERLTAQELEDRHLPDIPENALDVDVLIGEPAAIGFGFGGQALKLLADRVRSTGEAPMMGMVVAIGNRPARTALLNAGFRVKRDYLYPGYEPCHLIVMDLQTVA